MSCKYLTAGFIFGESEVGGSLLPQRISASACKVGRKPDTIGWATKCGKTSAEGPCWFWLEQHGDKPDLQFGRKTSPV